MKAGKQPWVRVRLNRLMWLCYEAPARLRWRFAWGPTTRLHVVSPRGAVWYFKINGGCWLQKET